MKGIFRFFFKIFGGTIAEAIAKKINGKKTKYGAVIFTINSICLLLLWFIRLIFPEINQQIPENIDGVFEIGAGIGGGLAGIGVGHKIVKTEKKQDNIDVEIKKIRYELKESKKDIPIC